jgi:hypothetical protein
MKGVVYSEKREAYKERLLLVVRNTNKEQLIKIPAFSR